MSEEKNIQKFLLSEDQKEALKTLGLEGIKREGHYTTQDFAEMVGKCRRTIQRWVKEGKLEAIPYNGTGPLLILGKAIIKWGLTQTLTVPDYIGKLAARKVNGKKEQITNMSRTIQQIKQEVKEIKKRLQDLESEKNISKKKVKKKSCKRKIQKPRGFYSTAEFADKHEKNPSTVENWCRKGKIKSIRYNGRGSYFIKK